MLVPLGLTRSNEAATRETDRGNNEPRRRAKALHSPPYSPSLETQAQLGRNNFARGWSVYALVLARRAGARRRCARASCSSNHIRPGCCPGRDDRFPWVHIALRARSCSRSSRRAAYRRYLASETTPGPLANPWLGADPRHGSHSATIITVNGCAPDVHQDRPRSGHPGRVPHRGTPRVRAPA
jgi:hypothetical protein